MAEEHEHKPRWELIEKLHDKIDDNIRHHSYPYLHINSETIQLDLFGSDANYLYLLGL